MLRPLRRLSSGCPGNVAHPCPYGLLMAVLALLLLAPAMQAQAQWERAARRLEPGARTSKPAFQAALAEANANDTDSTKIWDLGAVTSLTLNQTALVNWSAGGDPNLNILASAGLFADYEKDRLYWFSLLDMSYGITATQDLPMRKTNDYLELNTKVGYTFRKRFSVTAFAEAITQFTAGFDYAADPEGETPISNFMAPGYLMQGLGLAYERKPWGLSVRVSPITAREVVVLDPMVDETRYQIEAGNNMLLELGASIRVNYLQEFLPYIKKDGKPGNRLTLESRLMLFSDYLNRPDQVLFNWRSKLDYKITSWLTINVMVHLIYDPNVQFQAVWTDGSGGTVLNNSGARLQFMETLGIGLGYHIVN